MARRAATVAAMLAATCMVTLPLRVTAQATPACVTRVLLHDRESQWVPPLDRVVSVQAPAQPLPALLDRVASVSGVALSFSPELLPSAPPRCLQVDRVPLGALLATLVEGSSLQPVSVGAAQIVLAPARLVAGTDAPGVAHRTSLLDRVVVTGTPDGAAQRGSPYNLEVIDGATLARQRLGSLTEALDVHVPGIWSWSASSGGVVARYGSVRGASSFGTTTPKVYVDGIEVANPLLVTLIDPARVDRVEVIRGPQGAALYGADAISGVINIQTRHDGAGGGRSLLVATNAGFAATDYAPQQALAQEHALSARIGDASHNAGLGVSVASIGEYLPGAGERRLLADGSVRWLRGRGMFTGTARLASQRANAAASPFLTGIAGATPTGGASTTTRVYTGLDTVDAQATTQYTLGGTAVFMPDLRWTHTLIAGVDGYRLRGVSNAILPIPSTADSALRDAEGAGDRLSLRWRSTARFDASDATSATLLVGAEQSLLRSEADAEALYAGTPPRLALRGAPNQGLWSGSSGLLAQGSVAHRERVYATAGLRLERTEGVLGDVQWSALPMVGASVVHDVGTVTLKARAAYGRGIRPSQHAVRGVTAMGRALPGAALALDPEAQEGTEVGGDLLLGRSPAQQLSLHLTRFDQRAAGLIQPVAVPLTRLGAAVGERRIAYVLQNVGAIDNSGWEVEARARAGALSASGTLALVASDVVRVARGYTGDLRAGDRMLEVPMRTASATLGWTTARWGATMTLSHAADWVGYDRVAIATRLAGGTVLPRDITGASLRDYWRRYDGITRLRAQVSWSLRPSWAVLAGGDNLLDVQQGTPDNSTVMAGRTVMVGVRAGF
jgi:iron complex outermembrane receptor protein